MQVILKNSNIRIPWRRKDGWPSTKHFFLFILNFKCQYLMPHYSQYDRNMQHVLTALGLQIFKTPNTLHVYKWT